ncbi:hypothetical protein AB0O82_37710 [Kitasatospora sp. NPDC088264]|uniref:hypothetical protein n=1 Tax=Kitasatospora sp. NPDC088264 TaxID=3155296 RepID=UPI00341E7C0E
MAGGEHEREDVVVDPVGVPRQFVRRIGRGRRAGAELALGGLAREQGVVLVACRGAAEGVMARRRAVASSQPTGLVGTPPRAQLTSASASVSWATSSASAKSPV